MLFRCGGAVLGPTSQAFAGTASERLRTTLGLMVSSNIPLLIGVMLPRASFWIESLVVNAGPGSSNGNDLLLLGGVGIKLPYFVPSSSTSACLCIGIGIGGVFLRPS